MNFSREEPVKVSFDIPDRPTVRQQMAYYSEATGVTSRAHLERLWLGTRTLIVNWECELFQFDVDLDTVDDPRIMDIMLWAAVRVRDHLNKLGELPKTNTGGGRCHR